MVVTFVFSSDPAKIRKLDKKRLNKQRIEANQILDTITGKSKGWQNHPAVKMWIGHENALKVYINNCIRAWRDLGYNCALEEYEIDETDIDWPWWYTWKPLHLSHKCSLLRKNPEHYEKIFKLSKTEKEWLNHGYIWPSKLNKKILKGIDDGKTFKPIEICDPIGMGAPAQYRWTLEEVLEWKNNKTVNPKTGKTINPKSKTGVYSDVKKAYGYYKEQEMI